MATWKKLIVSGSNIGQLNNDVGYITASAAVQESFATASFDGTNILANTVSSSLNFASGSGAGLLITANPTTDTLTFTLDSVPNTSLQSSSIHIGDTSFELGATASVLSGLEASGSFSGSFEGDGSKLTGIATSLDISGSYNGAITSGSVSLLTQGLTLAGTTNEVDVTAANQTITVGLPDDVTITQDLTVNRNLTVIGTASFQHTENLEVADRFIRLASGSNTEGDGGIVIQQASDGTGDVFGFDGVSSDRWAVAQNFDGSGSAFTPEAFMAVVLTGSANTDPTIQSAVGTRYNKSGNIYTETGGNNDIWIYS